MFAVVEKDEVLLEGTPFCPRRESRNRMNLGVVFRWKDADGAHEGQGITRDWSSKGIFVRTTFPPSVKKIVRCYVLMPSLTDADTEEAVDLEATLVGRVVRTEHSDVSGFAVEARVFGLARI